MHVFRLSELPRGVTRVDDSGRDELCCGEREGEEQAAHAPLQGALVFFFFSSGSILPVERN
jgi:hypothetical protein